MARAKLDHRTALTPDDLLEGCLRRVARFGVVRLGRLLVDLEVLGIKWIEPLPGRGSRALTRTAATNALLDQAGRIQRSEGARQLEIEHVLAAYGTVEAGLMRQLRRTLGIGSGEWRAAVAEWSESRAAREEEAVDYLSPEEAAVALGLHVQTIRAYVRSGKLPAQRVAGERAIRIRRPDLALLMEPLGS